MLLPHPKNADETPVLVAQVSSSQLCSTSVYSDAAEYWKDLASGANFLGRDLRQCLEIIHDDIANFPSLPMVRRHEFSPILRLINRFSYLMRVSELNCPSWWLTSPTRKGLRRMTVCKYLTCDHHLITCSLILPKPRIQSEHDKCCRSRYGERRHSRGCCEPRWFYRRTNSWCNCVRQVGLRCL